MRVNINRTLNVIAAITCGALLGGAFYVQWVMGVEPCPLCVLQRVFLLLLGSVFLIAAWHHPGAKGIRIYGMASLLLAAVGAALAARQLWLQHQPLDPTAACLPGLQFLLQTVSITEVLKIAIKGTAECGQVEWSIAGISLAGWTLLCFIGLAVGAIIQLVWPAVVFRSH